MPQASELLPPWKETADVVKDKLGEELRKEVAQGHPLYGIRASVVAKRQDRDDVLFALEGHSSGLAVVHLTWKGKPELNPTWPSTTFYSDWQDWVERCMKPANREWEA